MRTRPKSSPRRPPVCSPPENRHLASQIEESITVTEESVEWTASPILPHLFASAQIGEMLRPALEVT